jgi:ribosome biogenesis GTPase
MSDPLKQREALKTWGLKEIHELEIKQDTELDLFPARVIRQYKGSYVLETGLGLAEDGYSYEVPAQVSGAFSYKAADERDFPITGDFVMVRGEINPRQKSDQGPKSQVMIEKILTRTNILARKALEQYQEQILASNFDFVFLIFALDGERGFLARTLERLLTMAWDTGAQPVIILNKADLADDAEEFKYQAELSAPGVPVLPVSALEKKGLEQLEPYVKAGTSSVFLGQSGMGKSTLLNALMGKEVQATAAVRENDARGRHTTSTRDLICLDNGAMIIDTPGIRTLSLSADEDTLETVFQDISEFAENCKFGDCTHTGEPGCAVQAALNEGVLDYERYQAYLDYKKELQYFERKSDRRLQQQEKEKWKAISKFAKNLYKNR